MHHNLYTSHSCQKSSRFTMRAANKRRSLPDAPSPPHPFLTPFFPFLSFPSLPASPQNFFLSNRDLSGNSESRPDLSPCARTHAHAHKCMSTPINTLPNEHSTPTPLWLLPWKCLTAPRNSFQTPLQDLPREGTRWHCVSSCFRGKREYNLPPPPEFMFRSGLDAEVNQMYELHPPPSSTESRLFFF